MFSRTHKQLLPLSELTKEARKGNDELLVLPTLSYRSAITQIMHVTAFQCIFSGNLRQSTKAISLWYLKL